MPLRGLFCLRFSISAIALLAGLWPAVAGADTVSIRAGERGQGARLILDWPSPVAHTARLSGQQLTLSFARTVEADVDGLSQRLSGWISSARHSADGKQIVISLKRNVQLSSFAAGKQVVVDLQPELATSPTPPLATRITPAEKAPSFALLQVRVGHHRDYNRAVMVLGSKPVITRSENKITLSVPTSRQLSPAQLAQLRLPQVASVVQSLEQDKLTISFTLKPNTKVSEFNVAKGIGLDFAAAPAAQVAQVKPPVSTPEPVKPEPPKAEVVEPKHEEAAATPVTTPAPAPAPVTEPVTPPAAAHVEVVNKPDDAPSPQAAPVIKPVEVSSIKDGVLPTLLMSVQADTPVAVFRRGSALYVVVSNNNTPRELIPLVGSALAATDKVELLPADGGRVVRIDLTGLKTEPQLLPVQGGWSVSFPETGQNDIKPLEVVEDASFSTGARIIVKTQNASNAVSFADPLLGDELIAVPVSSALSGVDHALRYVQADLMPTLQGIAIKPWADGLTVINGGNGVEISLHGGMAIAEKLASEITPPTATPPPAAANTVTAATTPAPQGAAPVAEVEQLPTLFDFRSYGNPAGEKFTDQRMALQNEIAKQMPEDGSESWMNFARFYFINGMPTEADAIWQSVAARNPDVKDLPDFKLIHAIAEFSSGSEANRDAALAAANQPSSDYALWSGLRAVEKRDWATASDNFKRASERIWEYPEPYRSRLAIGAIEALLNTKDLPLARSQLDKLSAFYTAEGREKTPAMEYMTGILAWNQRQGDQARAHLGSAAQSWNQLWRVRAELALIDADIKDNKLPPDKVLERVDRLRFAWRGDALEFDILHRLAAQHINIGNYAAAFDDYAKLTEKFPNDPRTAGLGDEQKDSFTRIFQGPDRDKNQPFSQLAVWEGYPKFRPTQKEVLNGINTYMAERVTSMDLLSRAAEFYNEVLKNTTDPVARAELGVKIAGLYLLDKNSAAALKALTETDAKVVAGQPSPLSNTLRDERRMLNSRALSGLGKVDDALALLNSDYSDPAMRLRVDVNWRAKRWPETAAQLESLIGPPPATGVALTPQKSAMIVSRATALALSGDSKGLRDLRVKFGAAMASTGDASTFQLLTRPEVAGGLPDRNTLNSRVAEVDLFQKFLERYRSTASTPAAEAPVAAATEHH